MYRTLVLLVSLVSSPCIAQSDTPNLPEHFGIKPITTRDDESAWAELQRLCSLLLARDSCRARDIAKTELAMFIYGPDLANVLNSVLGEDLLVVDRATTDGLDLLHRAGVRGGLSLYTVNIDRSYTVASGSYKGMALDAAVRLTLRDMNPKYYLLYVLNDGEWPFPKTLRTYRMAIELWGQKAVHSITDRVRRLPHTQPYGMRLLVTSEFEGFRNKLELQNSYPINLIVELLHAEARWIPEAIADEWSSNRPSSRDREAARYRQLGCSIFANEVLDSYWTSAKEQIQRATDQARRVGLNESFERVAAARTETVFSDASCFETWKKDRDYYAEKPTPTPGNNCFGSACAQ